ncbi:MAG: hypothetical protein ACREDY_22440 [Bradyrhizobium sp.]
MRWPFLLPLGLLACCNSAPSIPSVPAPKPAVEQPIIPAPETRHEIRTRHLLKEQSVRALDRAKARLDWLNGVNSEP